MLLSLVLLVACRLDRGGLGLGTQTLDGGVDVGPSSDSSDTGTETGTCGNGVRDGDESDVDCGGACAPCGVGQGCSVAADCITKKCGPSQSCVAPPQCEDGAVDGAETDVDCGGPICAKCLDGKACSGGSDCASASCGSGNTCRRPSCSDGVRNGSETDADCGGSCPNACDVGQACRVDGDCVSFLCNGKSCEPRQSCRAIRAAAPTGVSLKSGSYTIDPDGSAGALAPFLVYCEMSIDGGGWTFFAHANQDYVGGKLFEADVGRYHADRTDDGTTYGLGATLLKRAVHTNMMVTLDRADPLSAAAANKLLVLAYPAGSAGFSSGPIPCVGLSPFEYRLTTTGATIPGFSGSPCDTLRWYLRSNGDANYLTNFLEAAALGNFWGIGMGGDDSWSHDGYWYVR